LLGSSGQGGWRQMGVRFGKTFRVKGVLATCEPAAVHALLTDRVHTAKRSRVHEALRKIPGADGILFLDGDAWMRRLRALTPVFHANHVDSFVRRMHDAATARAAKWREAGRIGDLYDEILQLGASIVLSVGYGVDPESAIGSRLSAALVAYKLGTL